MGILPLLRVAEYRLLASGIRSIFFTMDGGGGEIGMVLHDNMIKHVISLMY